MFLTSKGRKQNEYRIFLRFIKNKHNNWKEYESKNDDYGCNDDYDDIGSRCTDRYLKPTYSHNLVLNVAYKALNVTIDYARSKYKGTGAGKSQKDRM